VVSAGNLIKLVDKTSCEHDWHEKEGEIAT